MDISQKSTTQIVRAGFDRACIDFTKLVVPFGFSKFKARFWSRQADRCTDFIHFHRSGVSYGAPSSNSIAIRVHFASHLGQLPDPITLNGPNSDQLRDSDGYAYHLRFNALTWSTYDRCLDDLIRALRERGLPWFATQRVFEETSKPD